MTRLTEEEIKRDFPTAYARWKKMDPELRTLIANAILTITPTKDKDEIK